MIEFPATISLDAEVVRADDVREYLDSAIREWRKVRVLGRVGNPKYDMARYYVDAFQSARVSILGELLP